MAREQSPASPDTADPSSPAPLQKLAEIDARLAESHRPIIQELERVLADLTGNSFGLRNNQDIAVIIQGLLERLGLRVRCPTCSRPAILRCRAARNAKGGSFQFEHFVEKKQTNHGGSTTFPALTLVPAPPDLRRRKRGGQRA